MRLNGAGAGGRTAVLLPALLLGGLLFGAGPAAQAQTAAGLIGGWSAASCASSSCHGSPIVGSTASNDKTSSVPVQRILDLDMLTAPALTDANTITSRFRTLCSRAPHTGSYMCNNYNTAYIDTDPAVDPATIQDIYRYLFAARHTLTTAAAGATTITVAPYTAASDAAALAFDSVALNSPTASATVWTVAIANFRNRAVNLTLTSSNAADFPLDTSVPGSCNGASTTVGQVPAASGSVAGTCTLKLGYKPTGASTAARSGTLTVAYASAAAAGQFLPSNPGSRQLSLSGGVLTRTLSVPATAATFSAASGSSQVVALGTLRNSGNADLQLQGFTYTSTAAPNPYSALADAAVPPGGCRSDSTIAGGSLGCVLYVRFAPTGATASYPGNVSIAHTGSNSPTSYAFTGTALQPQLSISPSSVNFGRLAGGASADRDITISNSGGAGTLLRFTGATPVGITGDGSATSAPAAYSVVANSCGATLQPGAANACVVRVRYSAPAVTGTTRGTARLAVSTDAGTATVDLTGTALPEPAVSVTPAAAGSVPPPYVMQFSPTPVSSTNATTGLLTIVNRRDAAITYRVTTSGATGDFAIVDSCASGVPGAASVVPASGGAACTLSVRFAPGAAGGAGVRTVDGVLAFAGTGTDPAPAAQAVRLTGNATTAPVFGIASHTVTLQSVVGTPVSTDITISNPGSATLTLGSLVPGGNFPGDYALAGDCTAGRSLPGRVPPAAPSTCTLTIGFTPGQIGLRDATLTVNHNADGGFDRIDLQGTGRPSTSPVLEVGGGALDFGDVPQGATATRSFTVRNGNGNAGATALVLSSLAVTSGSADYSLVGSGAGSCSAGLSLSGGQSCSATVTFVPAATGARPGVVGIGSNAGNAAVNLAGNGAALAEPVVTGDPQGAFPATLVGTASSSTRSVTIANPRSNAVRYASAFGGSDAADFAVTAESCAARSVPGGGNCTLTLRFTPTAGAAGSRVAALALTFTGTGADPAPAAQSLTITGVAAVPAPVFSISAGTIAITAVVGGSAVGTAVVSNTGTAALTLAGLGFGGSFAADYALAPANSCSATTSLAPSSSCTLAIGFTPAAAGSRDATLTLTHNAAGSPQTVTLRGTATAAPQGRIELSVQRTLVFADTALGGSSAQSISVRNSGDAALNFASLTLAGAAAGDFERAGTCAAGVALAVNDSCSVVITFRPTALGVRAASITIQSDASNGPATIALSGSGVPAPAPQVGLSTPALAFGTQTLGGIYPSRVLRLSNAGSAALSIASITVSGAGFADRSADPCPASLAPGSGCDIDIAFTPAAAGTAYTGTVSVASNAAGSPHSTALSGAGTTAAVPVLSWSPNPNRLDFGAVSAGSVSAPQSLQLLNQGPGGVVLTLLNAVGRDAANFPVSAGSCAIGEPLFEGASCRIDVRFAPGSAGDKTATVQVASTGSLPPALALAGNGLAGPSPGLSVSVTTLSFAETRVGAQSLPSEVTLSSDGSGVVRVRSMAVSGPYSVQNKSCPAVPFVLASGSDCTVTVTFQPQAEGGSSGVLSVGSDADPAQREVALAGTAVPKADLSSGGCSLATGSTLADPTLGSLLALAVAALLYRRRARAARRRAGRGPLR